MERRSARIREMAGSTPARDSQEHKPTAMLDRDCKCCTKPFKARPAQARAGRGLFCSLSCAQLYRASQPKPAREPNRECAFCQTRYYRPAKKNSDRSKSGLRFCSRRCHSNALSAKLGFESIRPAHYDTSTTPGNYRQRVEIKACLDCGWDEIPEVLEVHHIDENRQNNTPANLAVLCPRCHSVRHFKARSGPWKHRRAETRAESKRIWRRDGAVARVRGRED